MNEIIQSKGTAIQPYKEPRRGLQRKIQGPFSLVAETEDGKLSVVDQLQGMALMADPHLTERDKRAVMISSVSTITDALVTRSLTPHQFNRMANSLAEFDDTPLKERLARALINTEDDFPSAAKALSDTFMVKLGCPDIRICSPQRLAVYFDKMSYDYYTVSAKATELRKNLKYELALVESAEEAREVMYRNLVGIEHTLASREKFSNVLNTLFEVISERAFGEDDDDFTIADFADSIKLSDNGFIYSSTERILRMFKDFIGNEAAEMVYEHLENKGRISTIELGEYDIEYDWEE